MGDVPDDIIQAFEQAEHLLQQAQDPTRSVENRLMDLATATNIVRKILIADTFWTYQPSSLTARSTQRWVDTLGIGVLLVVAAALAWAIFLR